jgi:hypothetical protein
VKLVSVCLMFVLFGASGCSVVMEATRPTPTDLQKFTSGEPRHSVLQQLGTPVDSVVHSDGTNCDNYLLYTRGYGNSGKAGIALAESAADALTLGASEIVLTPTEALTRNKKHPVEFCYSSGKLVRVERTDLAQPVALHQPQPIQQNNEPPRTSTSSAKNHVSAPHIPQQAVPEAPAYAPILPPTVIVPAS